MRKSFNQLGIYFCSTLYLHQEHSTNHRQFDDSINAVLLPEDQMTTKMPKIFERSPTTTTAIPEKIKPVSVRHLDHTKIQSDTKDIALDDNILVHSVRRTMKVAPVHHPTAATTAVPRTTHAKTYSNAAGSWDDVQTLTANMTIKKRHRRRRQGR